MKITLRKVLAEFSGILIPQHSAPKEVESWRKTPGGGMDEAGQSGAATGRSHGALNITAGPGWPAFPPSPGCRGAADRIMQQG